jgi:hypothetical protein
MATVVQTSSVSRFNGQSNSSGASITLTGVTAGNALLVVPCSTRLSTASGRLVDAVTSSPSATFSAAGTAYFATAGGHRVAIEPFIAHAVTGGSMTVTLDTTYETNNTGVSWFVVELSGLASSASFDKTDDASAADGLTTITAGPTATLATSSQFVLAVAASRFWWNYNGGSSAPSGYTALASNVVDDGVGTTFQASYKNVSATTAVDATWTVPSGSDGGVAIVSTFRNSALRVRWTFVNGTPPDDIDGVTGITSYVWQTTPDAGPATVYTGGAAEVSGNTLFTPAPGWASASDTVTGIHVSSGGGASPLMLGTVE